MSLIDILCPTDGALYPLQDIIYPDGGLSCPLIGMLFPLMVCLSA